MTDATVVVLGTLDTKGPEFAFLESQLESRGLSAAILDISCLEVREAADPAWRCTEVAERAGWSFEDVAALDKSSAGAIMIEGASSILEELQRAGRLGAVMGMGGANGTLMVCRAMRGLPIGLPKIVVSVVAAGDPRANVGTRDIALFNAVTDLALNSITRDVISKAAAAVAGMVRDTETVVPVPIRRVGASMLGLTQGCVLGVKGRIEGASTELLPFHANGIGGRALEELIGLGQVDVVLDLTTNELPNNLLGGVFDAGPDRLEAAGRAGLPQVIAPGAVDFINFWGRGGVPPRYGDRLFLFYNEQNTLMRTNAEENLATGRVFGEKLTRSTRPVIVLIPTHGFSALDAAGGARGKLMDDGPGGPWHDPEAARAFLNGLKQTADPAVVDVREVDAHFNDEGFIQAVVSAYRAFEPR